MADLQRLLALAGEAAGYKGQWDNNWWSMCCGENHWDPLRHNHQAFRLLVTMKFRIEYGLRDKCVYVGKDGVLHEEAFSHHKGGREEALRWAIVRAAAAIGSPSTAPGKDQP